MVTPTSGITPTRLTELRRVQSIAASPCGTWAAVEVQRLNAKGSKYISDLWRVSTTDASVEPKQITRGPANDRAPAFHPDGSLYFLSNRPTEEDSTDHSDHPQVFRIDAQGGDPEAITDEPLGVLSFKVSAESGDLLGLAPVLPGVEEDQQRERATDLKKEGPSALHYTSTPVRRWDHWLPRTGTHLIAYTATGNGDRTRRDLTPGYSHELMECTWDVSPDGRRVAITQRHPGEDRVDDIRLVLIDTETGESRLVGADPGAMYHQPLFSHSGTQLAVYRSQRFSARCPRGSLVLLDIHSGDERPLAREWDRDAEPCAWTRDDGSLIVTAEDSGFIPAFRIEVATGSVIRLTATHRGGSHRGLKLCGDERIVGVRSRIHHPPEPFALEFAPAAEPTLLANLSGWTEAEGKAVADWQTMQVDSEDGKKIQTFLLRPSGKAGPFPTVTWIHGGPMSAWGDLWHWRWNPLIAVSAGYAVALPNPRGSTGYGYDLKAAIWGNVWGAQCYRDLMLTQDALEARSDVDPERTAAMGGSFGGYMTNWIGGQTDRFKALITHASLYDLRAFWGATDAARWFGHQLGGVPVDDDDYFARYSPHRFVKEWKTPALVIHGEKDYRVPVGEGLALFEALQYRGVESELLIFPDENHWVLKPRNIIEWYEHVLRFLDKYLKSA